MARVTPAAALKILVVTPYPIWPPSHGGRVRTFRLAAGLRHAGATVDVLCPWIPGQPGRSFQRDGVTVHPHVQVTGALRLLAGERWIPSLVTLSFEPHRLGWGRRLRRYMHYDVVQFEFCAQAAWMARVSRGPVIVYSAHNVEADYIRAQSGRARAGLAVFARRIESLERRAVATSDLIVTCTESDGDRLRELYAHRGEIVTAPNGFDEALLDFSRSRRRASARAQFGLGDRDLALLFVGGRAPHNVDAVRYLAQEILPRLGPRAHLLLAGDCGEAIGGGSVGRIHRLGFTGDLGPAWAAADVAVNPVAFGSGSNLKLLEYLAVGLPVVTTPVGLRGYEEFSSVVTVVPREEFAVTLGRPLADRRDARAMLTPLSWTMIGRRLSDTYGRVVRDSAARRDVIRATSELG